MQSVHMPPAKRRQVRMTLQAVARKLEEALRLSKLREEREASRRG